jgi:hypothetical protein
VGVSELAMNVAMRMRLITLPWKVVLMAMMFIVRV